ncbi:hypothetical protein SBADM41S_07042 [Streptomyces badius]
MCRVAFPARENVALVPMSWTFTSASSSPGANATSCTEVASAGMPGITSVPEGSSDAVSQSLPALSSALMTTAPIRPERVVTWAVSRSTASEVRVDSRMATLERPAR